MATISKFRIGRKEKQQKGEDLFCPVCNTMLSDGSDRDTTICTSCGYVVSKEKLRRQQNKK